MVVLVQHLVVLLDFLEVSLVELQVMLLEQRQEKNSTMLVDS